MKVKNPVLTGFHPDPSILRVGENYYLATSTFQWFPGVEIFHSTDLANWNFITRPLNEKRLLDMTGIPDSGGVWAPCLSYSDGIYYLVYSNVKTYRNYYKDVDNFIVTSADITGPWSDPVYINSSGFDPSLFHDTDGRKYFINMVWDHRDKSNAFYGIALQEYDAENKVLIGEPEIIFKGSSIGLTEGPHIYKIGDWYYLMCAEGGTYYEHAVTIARSKNVRGPYELPEEYPLMTAKGHPELELQKCGHGCLVDTPDGNWYIAHLCGRPNGNGDRCMLGRETAIQNLTLRDDGWFELSTPDKRALGFCSSRMHAEEMAKEFCKRGIKSVAVYSNADGEFSEERNVAIEQLKNQEIKVIFSVDMFNEGVDIASLDMVMFLRPTESPTVFLQQLGRGLRISKGKEYVNVLDFIGNYEKAGRAPFLLNGGACVGERTAYDYSEIEYPDDCIVDFDMRLIDLFREMDKKLLSLQERIKQEYYRVKELLDGKVPTRMELFTNMDDNIYEYCMKHSKENPFKRYMDFLYEIHELSDEELLVYNGIGKEFLQLIETTDMQKVYKMPILYGFYNDGNVRMAVTEDEVVESRKRYVEY